jgi:transposase InsO family protein
MHWKPWHLITVAIAGWMNRQEQDAIEFLKEENRILRARLGHKRIILNAAEKRRLSTAAKKLGSNLLGQVSTIFSPATLLKWHRMLVARKYDGCGMRGPKPKKANSVRALVLRMAGDNPDWGYGRIHGELKGLGFTVSWQTVRRIMLEHGLLPDPDKPYKTTWNSFLHSHWESIAACDFFSIEAWGFKGLTRYLVFFVIDLATRKVEIAGIHVDPAEPQMVQMARNLTDAHDGFLKDKRVLIHDRDTLYTKKFCQTLRAAGVRTLKLPKMSPNLNPVAEAFVAGIRRECLNKMIMFGERHVRYVVEQFISHYNEERPHQGLGNRRISECKEPQPADGPVLCRERLGGLLKSYYRKAA